MIADTVGLAVLEETEEAGSDESGLAGLLSFFCEGDSPPCCPVIVTLPVSIAPSSTLRAAAVILPWMLASRNKESVPRTLISPSIRLFIQACPAARLPVILLFSIVKDSPHDMLPFTVPWHIRIFLPSMSPITSPPNSMSPWQTILPLTVPFTSKLVSAVTFPSITKPAGKTFRFC